MGGGLGAGRGHVTEGRGPHRADFALLPLGGWWVFGGPKHTMDLPEAQAETQPGSPMPSQTASILPPAPAKKGSEP